MKITAKQISRTGILLALCIAFQCLKGLSVFITGTAVNAILVIAVLSTGFLSGLVISIVAPVVAYVMGMTPIVQAIPLMILVIMVGNALLVLAVALMQKKNLLVGMGIGSLGKFLWLWLMVWYVMLPVFGQNIPEKMQLAMRTTFSTTQLITALLGSAAAGVIWERLKKYLDEEIDS